MSRTARRARRARRALAVPGLLALLVCLGRHGVHVAAAHRPVGQSDARRARGVGDRRAGDPALRGVRRPAGRRGLPARSRRPTPRAPRLVTVEVQAAPDPVTSEDQLDRAFAPAPRPTSS